MMARQEKGPNQKATKIHVKRIFQENLLKIQLKRKSNVSKLKSSQGVNFFQLQFCKIEIHIRFL